VVLTIGFTQPEPVRLLEAVKGRDRSIAFSNTTAGALAGAARNGAAAALVWMSPQDEASGMAALREAIECGLPVVVFSQQFDAERLDPAKGTVEVCFPPFTPDEVIARLRLAKVRARGPGSGNVLVHGDLTIDLDSYEVTVAGRRLDLTYKEYELLRFLAASPGRVFTRESLLRSVWEYEYFGGTRTVDVHVRRLRSKIDDVKHRFIETVWNVGYRFHAPESRAADAAAEAGEQRVPARQDGNGT
jgi:DNA-binding response OmpR family regulator